MKQAAKNDLPYRQEDPSVLHLLDQGLDDMEAGREMPLDEAFQKISEMRDTKRNAML